MVKGPGEGTKLQKSPREHFACSRRLYSVAPGYTDDEASDEGTTEPPALDKNALDDKDLPLHGKTRYSVHFDQSHQELATIFS